MFCMRLFATNMNMVCRLLVGRNSWDNWEFGPVDIIIITPDVLQFTYFNAFGSACDARGMKTLRVMGGQYSLGGFYDTIVI
jgi:hypothetical protein